MEIHSSPKCSKDQQNIYQQWFNYVDKDGDGRITGNDATKIFAMSNLPRQDLKQGGQSKNGLTTPKKSAEER